jgi:hypothetical protein
MKPASIILEIANKKIKLDFARSAMKAIAS